MFVICLRSFTCYPLLPVTGRSSSGIAVPQVDRRLFVFTSPRNINDAFHPGGTFAKIERKDPRKLDRSPTNHDFYSTAVAEVLSCLYGPRVLEIVFDVNRRRERTHKHSGRSNFIFSLDL